MADPAPPPTLVERLTLTLDAVTPLAWTMPTHRLALLDALVHRRSWNPALWVTTDTTPETTQARIALRDTPRAIDALAASTPHALAEHLEPALRAAHRRAVHTIDAFEVRQQALNDCDSSGLQAANDAFAAWSRTAYGDLDDTENDTTTAAAAALLHIDAHSDTTTMTGGRRWDAPQATRPAQQILDTLAPGWTVRVAPLAANMTTRGARHELAVSATLDVTTHELRRLLIHESAHILRTRNAEAHLDGLTAVPLGPDITATEEGQAIWWEHHTHTASPQTMLTYAARALAVHTAQHGTIYDVMDALTPHLDPTAAAAIAIRVKRGVPDPMLPGAMVKDRAYLTGHRRLTTLAAAPEALTVLMSTKWALSLQPLAKLALAHSTNFQTQPLATPDDVRVLLPYD